MKSLWLMMFFCSRGFCSSSSPVEAAWTFVLMIHTQRCSDVSKAQTASHFGFEEREERFGGCFLLLLLNRRRWLWLRGGLQGAGFWGIHFLFSKRQTGKKHKHIMSYRQVEGKAIMEADRAREGDLPPAGERGGKRIPRGHSREETEIIRSSPCKKKEPKTSCTKQREILKKEKGERRDCFCLKG